MRVLLVLLLAGVGCAKNVKINTGESYPGGLNDFEWIKAVHTPFVSGRGMVVSSHRLASEWGARVLRDGGNAMDAAVATGFALSVVRPEYASLGGGGFMVYCPAKEPCTSIDFRERAPGKATVNMYRDQAQASRVGGKASGIPGMVAGYALAHQKFGKKSWGSLLSRPIRLASEGFRIHGDTSLILKWKWDQVNRDLQRTFRCRQRGKPCAPGEWLKQPDLARVLEAVSARKDQGFYKGWVARRIVKAVNADGGIFQLSDFSKYTPRVRAPLVGRRLGLEVVTMPPPSAGGLALLQMLRYLELANRDGFLGNGPHSTESIHVMAHAMGLTFADRKSFLGDPDYVDVPVQKLLSDHYMQTRWETTFEPTRVSDMMRGPEGVGRPGNTTHFSVIDRYGNAAAVTVTINHFFGSGVLAKGTGLVMNNEMDDFMTQPGKGNLWELVEGSTNRIVPGKRPNSSMSPTIVRDGSGVPRLVLGGAGGSKIPTAIFQAITNRVLFKMNLAEAVVAPRFHHQWRPTSLSVENFGIPLTVRRALIEMGYTIRPGRSLARLHTIERGSDGMVLGWADTRGGGVAVRE